MHRTRYSMSSSASTMTVDLLLRRRLLLLPFRRRSFLPRLCRMRRRERSASRIRRLEEREMGFRGEIQISGVKWREEREWWGDSETELPWRCWRRKRRRRKKIRRGESEKSHVKRWLGFTVVKATLFILGFLINAPFMDLELCEGFCGVWVWRWVICWDTV